jgi:hypothetical protein
MTSTLIFVFSLLAQLGPGDVASPIGATSGNTTSGGLGGLNRSDANLGDSGGPFTGGATPMSTGSENSAPAGTSGSTTSGTSTAGGTSTDIPITGATGASGVSGGTSSSTGIGGSTTGGMR